jgi:hypothetical protein
MINVCGPRFRISAAAFLEIPVAGKHAGFAVVDQQEIPLGDGREQLGAKILDPEIHGVAAGEAQPVHLRAHACAAARVGCCPGTSTDHACNCRDFGAEIGENVEIGDQRFAIVHVVGILACPEKRFSRNALETFQIDVLGTQELGVFGCEIVAYDRHQARFCEITGRPRRCKWRRRRACDPRGRAAFRLHRKPLNRQQPGTLFDCKPRQSIR